MADVSVKLKHGRTKTEVREATQKILGKMADKMGFSVEWSGDMAKIGGTGVKNGSLTIDDENVAISIDLALMAKPMKGMIEKMIGDSFRKHLGGEGKKGA